MTLCIFVQFYVFLGDIHYMDTTPRMKLSEFAKLNSLNYRSALNLFKKGEIKGIQTASGTIRVEGWNPDTIINIATKEDQ